MNSTRFSVEDHLARLNGKRIIVTGGAGGLGVAYVRALHAEGANVAIIDVNADAARQVANELGELCHFSECDVTDPKSVNSAFSSLVGRMGGLDCLVNNAGVYPHQHLDQIGLADWNRVIRTNLDSVFICTNEAVPHMRKQNAGKIINVTTNLVWIMAPLMAHYIAAKAGVLGFTRGAARELGAWGITINAIAPGANMPSEMLDTAGLARMQEIIGYQVIKRPQFAVDLTGPLIFLCSSDSDFMSGQVICVDGGVAVH